VLQNTTVVRRGQLVRTYAVHGDDLDAATAGAETVVESI